MIDMIDIIDMTPKRWKDLAVITSLYISWKVNFSEQCLLKNVVRSVKNESSCIMMTLGLIMI